jgi:hypothetical protein
LVRTPTNVRMVYPGFADRLSIGIDNHSDYVLGLWKQQVAVALRLHACRGE